MEERTIPELLRPSHEKGAFFEHCKVCNRELIEAQNDYCIEKVVKKQGDPPVDNVLFEYAICINCMNNLRNQMSAESQSAIMRYQIRKMAESPWQSEEEVMNSFKDDRCLFSGKHRDDMQQYTLVGYCRGKELQADRPPAMLDHLFLEEIQDLISDETRDELDRFSGDNFGWPPEVARQLKNGDLVFL